MAAALEPLGGYDAEIHEQFRAALHNRGIIPPHVLIDDGKVHRCDADGHEGGGDASYLLHSGGFPAGGFQNWTDGAGWQNWRADLDHLPTAEGASRASSEGRGRSGAAGG